MTFSQFGITDFQVQYWNGSSQTVPGGSVTGNNKVWKKFTFSSITTDKIRVYITNALATFSRLTEVEAYQSAAVSYSYDAAGNVTNDGVHIYQYDAENRLVTVDGGVTASYGYDHQNRRIKKTIGSTVTHYIWQGSHVIAEHDGNTPVGGSCDRPYGERSALVDYVYLGSRLISSRHYTHNCGTTWQWCDYVGYVQQAVTCSTDRYYISDRLSTRLLLDASGNVIGRMGHLPFGEDFAESSTQEKHHFTSYERDAESGTDYAVNRQYSQTVGRFVQSDPYQHSNLLDDPRSWNRYSYTRNVLTNRVDPLGLFDEGAHGPIEADCPLPGTSGGPFPGRCLCFTVPLACSPQHGPPNVDGQGNGPGGQQRQCPVAPLTPITDPDAQAFENNPNRVDLAHLTPAMQTAVNCFQSAVVNLGGTFTITSAWRPASYQQHLREVWDKYMALRTNNSSECRTTRQAVTAEFNRHGLIPNQGARPAAHSDHTRGIAIDATIQGLPSRTDVDQLGGRCGLSRPVAGDPVHWVLQ